jgi:hypothetical protein
MNAKAATTTTTTIADPVEVIEPEFCPGLAGDGAGADTSGMVEGAPVGALVGVLDGAGAFVVGAGAGTVLVGAGAGTVFVGAGAGTALAGAGARGVTGGVVGGETGAATGAPAATVTLSCIPNWLQWLGISQANACTPAVVRGTVELVAVYSPIGLEKSHVARSAGGISYTL